MLFYLWSNQGIIVSMYTSHIIRDFARISKLFVLLNSSACPKLSKMR